MNLNRTTLPLCGSVAAIIVIMYVSFALFTGLLTPSSPTSPPVLPVVNGLTENGTFTLGSTIYETSGIAFHSFYMHGFTDGGVTWQLVIGHRYPSGSASAEANMYIPIRGRAFTILNRQFTIIDYNVGEGWITLSWSDA